MGRMPALQQAAAALTVPNAFGALLQRQGAVGLNASTSHVCSIWVWSWGRRPLVISLRVADQLLIVTVTRSTLLLRSVA